MDKKSSMDKELVGDINLVISSLIGTLGGPRRASVWNSVKDLIFEKGLSATGLIIIGLSSSLASISSEITAIQHLKPFLSLKMCFSSRKSGI